MVDTFAFNISIHAPRVGSDVFCFVTLNCTTISIHAPRVGSDKIGKIKYPNTQDFNPRSPCGERR